MLVCLIDNKKYSGGLFAFENMPHGLGAKIVASIPDNQKRNIFVSHTSPGGWQILATGAANLLWP
jgi:hypothetical protein